MRKLLVVLSSLYALTVLGAPDAKSIAGKTDSTQQVAAKTNTDAELAKGGTIGVHLGTAIDLTTKGCCYSVQFVSGGKNKLSSTKDTTFANCRVAKRIGGSTEFDVATCKILNKRFQKLGFEAGGVVALGAAPEIPYTAEATEAVDDLTGGITGGILGKSDKNEKKPKEKASAGAEAKVDVAVKAAEKAAAKAKDAADKLDKVAAKAEATAKVAAKGKDSKLETAASETVEESAASADQIGCCYDVMYGEMMNETGSNYETKRLGDCNVAPRMGGATRFDSLGCEHVQAVYEGASATTVGSTR